MLMEGTRNPQYSQYPFMRKAFDVSSFHHDLPVLAADASSTNSS
jgi:hypothetical protein